VTAPSVYDRTYLLGGDCPGMDAFAITPSDATDFTYSARGLYVGVGGTVVLATLANVAITFVNVASGQILPVACRRVNSTGTTATNIIGLI